MNNFEAYQLSQLNLLHRASVLSFISLFVAIYRPKYYN